MIGLWRRRRLILNGIDKAMQEEKDNLAKIKSFIASLMPKNVEHISYPDGLDKEQYDELLLSIEESEDESKLVSQSEAHKMFAQWRER
jgi:hypothetical protein